MATWLDRARREFDNKIRYTAGWDPRAAVDAGALD
jgi:hypothetical protein